MPFSIPHPRMNERIVAQIPHLIAQIWDENTIVECLAFNNFNSVTLKSKKGTIVECLAFND